MKTFLITLAICLFCCAESLAQCPNCTPQQPTAAKAAEPQIQYVWVRQRRGLFGWRTRWVLAPVRPARVVRPIGVVW